MSTVFSFKVSADTEPVEILQPFWSHVVGAGRAAEGLRADWQRHLKQASVACGFRYVRFHGLFHDDMHVYHEVDGKPVYNFQYIDALFDAMLEMGVRPFVEFGFSPSQLATKLATVFWWKGNISPPTNLEKWGDLVRGSVQHWVARYGAEEVRTWYFECWNEPNLQAFWAGSRSQYYALYEVTAKVIKALDRNLRVGGPATSNYVPDSRFDGELEDFEVQKQLAEVVNIDSLKWEPVWVEHFLQWCHSRDLPVDFVSTHPYPTDWALDSKGGQSRRVRNIHATPKDLLQIQQIVSASPYPSAEIHLTEWNSSPSSRDHSHDYVPAAIYVARTMLASLNLVDTLAYWTFTDVFEEEGAGMEPFHGGFGLINLQGIPKPTFHAFRLLRQLGDEVLKHDPDHGIVTRNSKTGLLSVIMFHYPPEIDTSPPPAYLDCRVAEDSLAIGRPAKKIVMIENLRPGTAFSLELLAPNHPGDVISAWRNLGSPSTLNRGVVEQLTNYASTLNQRFLAVDREGKIMFEEELLPWTLIAMKQVEL
ncbi:glycoside hydrolase [Cadophora sp. MPI-SDFR-AT-0126]|nr:glycoside hydrolase [Leotiomycetes sp. MPI-SDFR-AT-0126]